MNSFFEELYKEISNENKVINEKTCLITNDPLLDDFVTLQCNHTFNYNAIFQEIKRQKHDPFKYEVDKLLHYQLKCPYCRYIQGGLLPPPKEYFVTFDKKYLVKGVNSPLNLCLKQNKCTYIYKKGSKKNQKCGESCFNEYCNYHDKQVKKSLQQKKHKQEKPETYTCQSIIKSGKRKGQTCNSPYKILVDNIHYCGRHKPK